MTVQVILISLDAFKAKSLLDRAYKSVHFPVIIVGYVFLQNDLNLKKIKANLVSVFKSCVMVILL